MPTEQEMQAFLADISKQGHRMAKQQKTDDIIAFIKHNWKLWSDDRNEVNMAVNQLYRDDDISVEHLSVLLGIPDGVFFKRVKREDITKAWLDFPKSFLFDTFLQCVDMRKSAEACLFAVCGKNALVITNMQTSRVPGKMHLFFSSMRNAKDIHLFMADEAPERMAMFRHFD